MSKFRNILYNAILYEAKILRLPNEFFNNQILTILKNPSPEEYQKFKSNTKYNSIRGIATDKDVYIADATVWLHDFLIQTLEEHGILKDSDVHTMFDEDNKGNLQIRGKGNPRLNEILKANKQINNENLSFFDIENFYNAYITYESEYSDKEEVANSYKIPKDKIDLYLYDGKPYDEKDDFETWLQKTNLKVL